MTDPNVEASIIALQEWSDQKYGQPFSRSACRDMLGALARATPPAQTNLAGSN